MSLSATSIARWTYRRLSCAKEIRIGGHQYRSTSVRCPGRVRSAVYVARESSYQAERCQSSLAGKSEEPKEEVALLPADERNATPIQTAAATTSRSVIRAIDLNYNFQNRLVKLPLNPEIQSYGGQFQRLPKRLLHAFSDIWWYVENGRRWEERKFLRQDYIKSADDLWQITERRSLANWLDNIHEPEIRTGAITKLLAGSILMPAQRILTVLKELEHIEDDFEVRASCLFITGVFRKNVLLKNARLMQLFDNEVDKLRDPLRWPTQCPTGALLKVLFWRSDICQTRVLVECLRAQYTRFHEEAAVVVASHCLRRGLHEEAFSFLQDLSPEQVERVDAECLECCLALLKYDTIVETEDGPSFRYLNTLLSKGVTPDARLYNKIIRTAISLGHEAVAWDVFDYARSIDIKINHKACLALVRTGFQTRNFAKLDLAMTYIYEHPELYRDKMIVQYAMNIVRQIHHRQAAVTPAHGLSHILALYDRVYTRAPLARFGFVQNHPPNNEGNKIEPTDYTIAYTVWAYILCHRHGQSIDLLWRRIVRLIDAGDEVVINTMKRDLVYNAVIWLNVKNLTTIAKGLEVFQYMLNRGLCLPTPRTWTILICGFLLHGKDEQARQLYQMMEEHGFTVANMDPTLVSKRVSLDDLRLQKEALLDEDTMVADTTLRIMEPFVNNYNDAIADNVDRGSSGLSAEDLYTNEARAEENGHYANHEANNASPEWQPMSIEWPDVATARAAVASL